MKRKSNFDDFSVSKKQHLEANLLDFVCGLPGVGARALECFTFPEQLKLKQVNKDLFRNSMPNMLEVVIENETQWKALQSEPELQKTIHTLRLEVEAEVMKKDFPALKHVFVTPQERCVRFHSDCCLHTLSFEGYRATLLCPQHLETLEAPSSVVADILPHAPNLTNLCMMDSGDVSLDSMVSDSLVNLECWESQLTGRLTKLSNLQTLVLRNYNLRPRALPNLPIHTLVFYGEALTALPPSVTTLVWKETSLEAFQAMGVQPQVRHLEVSLGDLLQDFFLKSLSTAAFPNLETCKVTLHPNPAYKFVLTCSAPHCSLVLQHAVNDVWYRVQIVGAVQSFHMHVQHAFKEIFSQTSNTQAVDAPDLSHGHEHVVELETAPRSLRLTSNHPMDSFRVEAPNALAVIHAAKEETKKHGDETLRQLGFQLRRQLGAWCTQYRKELMALRDTAVEFNRHNDQTEQQLVSLQQHVSELLANCQEQFRKLKFVLRGAQSNIPPWFEEELECKKKIIQHFMQKLQTLWEPSLFEEQKLPHYLKDTWQSRFPTMKVRLDNALAELNPTVDGIEQLYQALGRVRALYLQLSKDYERAGWYRRCVDHYTEMTKVVDLLKKLKQILLDDGTQQYLHSIATLIFQLESLPVQHQYASRSLFSFDFQPSFQ